LGNNSMPFWISNVVFCVATAAWIEFQKSLHAMIGGSHTNESLGRVIGWWSTNREAEFDRDSAGDAKTIGELMGGIQFGGSSDAMCAHWTVISDDRGMENRSF
jgi:hypothetical protein